MSTPTSKTVDKSAQHSSVQATKKEVEHPVDARLRRLNDKVLPTAPYILSSPGCLKDEFVKANYPLNAINWKKHSLFKPGEEELQYLTFMDRSDDGDIRSMYARGGWDDGKGRIAPPEEPYSRTSSDGTPRPGQAPRKKITLAEYHHKDRSKAATPAPKPVASKPKEIVKSKHEETVQLTKAKDVTRPQEDEHHGQKRSADTMAGTKDTQSFAHPPSSPPAKKARLTSESSKELPTIKDKPAPEEIKSAAVPNRLEADSHEGPLQREIIKGNTLPTSDVIHETSNTSHLEKSSMPQLPPMLSPLSSVVEEEIVKLTSAAHDSKATASKAGQTGTADKPTPVANQPKSSIPTKGPQEQKHVTSAPRQLVKETELKAATTPKAAPSGPPSGNKTASTPTAKTTPPDAPKKMRLRVSLKIKKKTNRKSLHAYTRMPPTHGRNSLFPSRPIEVENHHPGSISNIKANGNDRATQKADRVDSKSNQSSAPKTGDKRGRIHLDEDEPEPSSKRKHSAKVLQTQKPGTPKSNQTGSPAVSQLGSAQKHSTSTSSAQPNGTAMLRAASGQGSVHTPQRATVTETPAASSGGRRRRSWTSPEKPKSPDLRSESRQFQEMARTLKHKADVYLKKQEKMNEDERKLGVVLGTDDRTSWNSILPFLSNLQGTTEGISSLEPLSGLLSQLEGVIRDQIWYADMQLLDKNPLKHDFGKPNADASMSQEQHKAAEYHKYFQAFHNHVMKAQSAWRTGWVKLDVATLPSQYPKTWANHDEHRYAYGKGRDAVMKGEYKRKYNLPMSNMTSGLEAVNFGMVFLAEWGESKKIDWRPTLTL